MKRVIFLDNLKEKDIRPAEIYGEYKQILSEEVQNYFSDTSLHVKIDCPGCSDKNCGFVFNKMGFDYRACSKCGSLFVSPRPKTAAIKDFYKNSRAGLFLRKNILNKTLESRSKQILSYRLQWVTGLVEEYIPNANIFLDYATKYTTLLKQLNNANLFKSMISVLPECYEQEHLLPKDIRVLNNLDMVKDSIDLFSAFEVIERAFDPGKLFYEAYNSCKKNGLFILTSGTSTGFEYQVLGEYSPNIFPPDRLNLLSLEALISQIERVGFEIIEISTPGRLDVEIVKKTYEKNPDIPLDSFWKYLFLYRSESALRSFQEYLQQFQLSSHVRIAAIKK